jgi:hypothetical protein
MAAGIIGRRRQPGKVVRREDISRYIFSLIRASSGCGQFVNGFYKYLEDK